jgi:GTP-binding protein HflX
MTATQPKASDKVIIVRPYLKAKLALLGDELDYQLSESQGLASALGLEICGVHKVGLQAFRAATLVSQGTIDLILEEIERTQAGLVFIDTTLSPIQQRNLEKLWSVKVLDRTELILRIFSQRAESSEGRLQVELASLSYQKSRLVRTWTHLERQTGGFGFMAGPGESQLEVDRRLIDRRIDVLQKRIQQVQKTRALQRRAREKAQLPSVALVGHTNAGKSTLFNVLTDAFVPAEDRLFATLDPKIRQLKLPSGRRIALSDTVGFITELPPQLIAAFKATLEEVVHADIILHVHDMTSPLYEKHERAVETILRDLGVDLTVKSKYIHIINKIDAVSLNVNTQSMMSGYNERGEKYVNISALHQSHIHDLTSLIDRALREGCHSYRMCINDHVGEILAWLHERGAIEDQKQDDASVSVRACLSDADYQLFHKRFHASVDFHGHHH